MYAPRVFISMICAVLVFGVATYFIQDSFYTALVQSLICLVIIQVGYFACVLFLVAREKRQAQEKSGFQKDSTASSETSVTENVHAVSHHHAKLTDF